MVNVRKTSFFLIVLRLLSTFLKAASVLISARFFGTSAERDIFVLAMSMTSVLPGVAFGALSEIFRTKFVHTREALGLNAAVDSARTLIWCVFLLSLMMVIFGAVKADWLVNIFSENLSENPARQLRLMIRLTLPIIILTQLCNYWTQALNCFESFYFPEIVSMISGAAGIALVIFLAPVIGIYSLLVSAYFSHVLSLAVVLFLLRKKCPRFLSLKMENLGAVKPYAVAALPLFIGYFIGQTASVIVNRFSSGFGVGNVAILDYAQKITAVPQGVVISVVVSILTPALAAHFAKNRPDDFARECLSFYRFLLVLLAPCAFLMFFCSGEIGTLLFSSEISSQDMRKFSVVLSILTVGLFGVMHCAIFFNGLLARGRNTAVSLITALCQTAVLLGNILFAHRFGIWGLAACWSAFHVIAGITAMFIIKVNFKDTVASLIKVAALYAFSFGLFFLVRDIFYISGSVPKIIFNLSFFTVFWITGIFIFGFEERKKIRMFLTSRKNKTL